MVIETGSLSSDVNGVSSSQSKTVTAAVRWDELVVLVAQLVSRHSCVADRLPVVVRFSAGPRVRLKTVDPPKGNGLGQKKVDGTSAGP